MDRRTFLKSSAILGGTTLVSACMSAAPAAMPIQPGVRPTKAKAQVAFVKTTDRVSGVKKALQLLNLAGIKGKNLFLKPNFNSADVAPGSTHNDTLSTTRFRWGTAVAWAIPAR